MAATDATAPLASSGTPASHGDPTALAQGRVLGRYIVLSRLGSGGAGSVYAAYDSQIDRRVAIKILHGIADDDASSARHWQRIVREARLLGKLSHPNVVTLYGIETIDDVAFLAMELVPGTDLAQWMQTRRPWSDTVAIFLQAARGLAAAHAAGIVHGDFKPANVLLGDDGRVRVSDFGVARIADDRDPQTTTAESAALSRSSTVTLGRIAGTPYYMAPEQHDGHAPDARSDVYAFCVALHEALYGSHPFVAKTIEALALEKAGGPPRAPDGAPALPSVVRDVLARGMAPNPSDRIADVATLIAALDRPNLHRRRRTAMLGVVALAIGGGALWLSSSKASDEPCTGAARHLHGIWDDARKADVHAALTATALPYAEDAWTRVDAGLTEYADAWVVAHTETCRATQLGEQSEQLLDLRMQCLEQRRGRLAALVDVLAGPTDAAVVRNAADSLAALEPLARCADTERLSAGPTPPADPRVAEIEAALDRSSAYGAVGKFRDAREASERALPVAEQLAFDPLLAEVLLELGSTQAQTGDPDLAAATLERAHFLAEKVRHDDVAATSAQWLTYVVGDQQRRDEAGLQWAKQADAAITRVGDDPKARAQYLLNVGFIHFNAARHDDAQAAFEQALAIRERELGPDAAEVALVLGALGNVAAARKDYAAADGWYARSLTIKRKHLGEQHPSLGITWLNLGLVARNRGDYEGAQAHYESAKSLWERTLGPEHPQVAIAYNNIGTLQGSRGDHQGARDAYAKACEIWKQALDPEHPDIAMCLMNMGSAERNLGDLDRARALIEESLRLRIARLGEAHPDIAGTQLSLGDVEWSAGNFVAALSHYDKARAIWTTALGEAHPDLAYVEVGTGRALSGLGRHDEAIAALQRAVDMRSQGTEPRLLAGTQFELAKILTAAKRERERARDLAERARTTFAQSGAHDEQAAEITTWLASR